VEEFEVAIGALHEVDELVRQLKERLQAVNAQLAQVS
jgi:hypothetical protein